MLALLLLINSDCFPGIETRISERRVIEVMTELNQELPRGVTKIAPRTGPCLTVDTWKAEGNRIAVRTGKSWNEWPAPDVARIEVLHPAQKRRQAFALLFTGIGVAAGTYIGLRTGSNAAAVGFIAGGGAVSWAATRHIKDQADVWILK